MPAKAKTYEFAHPKYWLTWSGVGLLWLLVKLPWRIQMICGKGIGLALHQTLKKRRKVCETNFRLAFPGWSEHEYKKRVQQHFISLGQGLIETALSWWGRKNDLEKLASISGLEHLHDAQKNGGVILLSAHFTSLEIGGRLLAMHTPLHVIYRPHQNLVIENISAKLREKRYGKAISRNNIKAMIHSLKNGHVVWYAQDQHFNKKNSLLVPFFGIKTATNTATSRIAKITNAKVVPFFTVRLDQGYDLQFLPPLKNFPSNSIEEDTHAINLLIEAHVRKFPTQYLWTHKRFKTTASHNNQYQK